MVKVAEQKKQNKKETSPDNYFTTAAKANNTITINQTEYDELKSENAKLRIENLVLQEKVDLLTYKRFVHSSEKDENDKQASLFNEDEVPKPEVSDDTTSNNGTPVKAHTRRPPGRKPIPENLERVVVMNDLPEAEKHCICGKGLVKIGEDVNEKIVIEKPRIYVEQTVTPKYVCPCCKAAKGDEDAPCTIRTAPPRPAILPGSIAGAKLLAYIFIAKFCDGLPYYRLEKQFNRIDVTISRQDMANWQVEVFEKLTILFQLMMDHLKTGTVLRMDETSVQVMGEEEREDTEKSYIWLARGGPPGQIVIIFKYRPTRASENIDEFVDDFRGYLQTDGYEGYDCALKHHPGIIHVGCYDSSGFIVGKKTYQGRPNGIG
jgi:transposase